MGGSVNGDYYATGNSLITPTGSLGTFRDRLIKESTATVATDDTTNPTSGIPANATIEAVYLYWSGWIDGTNSNGYSPLGASDITDVILEDGASFAYAAGPPVQPLWTNGSRWAVSSNQFRLTGSSSASTAAQRTIASRAGDIKLAAYTGRVVILSWSQTSSGLESTDYFYFKLTSGASDTGWIEAFHGTSTPAATYSYTIPQAYLTDVVTISFFGSGAPSAYTNTFTQSNDTVNIDNISIDVPAVFKDTCDALPGTNWSSTYTGWTVSSNQFRATGAGVTTDRYLTMATGINLSTYLGKTMLISWDNMSASSNWSSATDYLYLSYSGNGGTTWSTPVVAFNNKNRLFQYRDTRQRHL